MSNEGIPRQYDKGIAPNYSEKSLEKAESDQGRNFLKKTIDILPRTARIVDIGAGSGIDLKTYQNMGFTELVGVEPSEKLRQEASISVGPSVRIVNGTFESTGLPNNSVDAVVSRFAMHYSPDIEKSIGEVARILKDGGIFTAIVSHPDADAKVAPNADGTVNITLFKGTVPIRFPIHSREEYLGDTFKSFFDLKDLEEYVSTEQDRGVTDPTQPNALCFVANRKKRT